MGKDNIRANNMSAILSCIYKNGPVSRRDIAKTVNLTPSAVTLLVSDMIQNGLLREGAEIYEGLRAGRSAVGIDFDPAYGHLLGICIEATRLSFAITHIGGSRLEEEQVLDKLMVPNVYSPDDLLEALLQLTDDFLLKNSLIDGGLCAIGINISGNVQPDIGASQDSYGILPPQTAVTASFEQRYNVPAFLDNNVRSLAIAELGLSRGNADGCEVNGVFIKHDPGFGCTVILHGEVFSGVRHNSGEVGHTHVLGNERSCICGKTGCLSTIVCTEALLRATATVFGPTSTPSLWQLVSGAAERIDLQALVRAASLGDAPLVRILTEAAMYMSNVIETSLLLMDGETVITFGKIFEDNWFFSLLHDTLTKSFGSFRSLNIKKSQVSDGDRWKGAIFIAMLNYIKILGTKMSARKEI